MLLIKQTRAGNVRPVEHLLEAAERSPEMPANPTAVGEYSVCIPCQQNDGIEWGKCRLWYKKINWVF